MWERNPEDIQGATPASPQGRPSVLPRSWGLQLPVLSSGPFPSIHRTDIYIVAWQGMGQSVPFPLSLAPETSSCYSWNFSSSKHNEEWLLALKKKIWILIGKLLGEQVSLTFESVNLIWSSSLEAPCWTWVIWEPTVGLFLICFSITQQQNLNLGFQGFLHESTKKTDFKAKWPYLTERIVKWIWH